MNKNKKRPVLIGIYDIFNLEKNYTNHFKNPKATQLQIYRNKIMTCSDNLYYCLVNPVHLQQIKSPKSVEIKVTYQHIGTSLHFV